MGGFVVFVSNICLFLSLLFPVVAIPSQTKCISDENCSLNGLCIHGSCVCDPGWRSADCSSLDVRQTPQISGYNLTHKGTSSWGGSIVHDPTEPQLYHLFVSEFLGGCGLDFWSPFSRIVRAESTTGPLGPYRFAAEVVGMFAHNPTVVYSAKDGLYLLYYIGCAVPQPANCELAKFTCGKGNDLNGESGISVMSSSNLKDWKPHGYVFTSNFNNSWDTTVTNPSVYIVQSPSTEDESFLLAYRGCPYNCGPPSWPEHVGIASAPTFAGPFTRSHGNSPVFAAQNEDPFLWRDKRGNYHMLLHSLEPNGGFGNGPNVGRHAFARDWSGPWTFNEDTLAYNTTARFTDGTTKDYFRMERPQLWFSDDGLVRPLVITNGVQEMGAKGSYTLIRPIGENVADVEGRMGKLDL